MATRRPGGPPSGKPQRRLGSGAVIAGRYRLDARVGQGASGSVWRAEHLQLGSEVAVKLLHLGDQGPRRTRAAIRFEREARLAASVQHRNVVRITDYGRESEDFAFMAMEYLGGGTLADIYDEGATGVQLLQLMLEALHGLIAVHDAGLVHRDLKPENIALKVEGELLYPKLVDFGISRQLRQESSVRSAVTTIEGRIIGTPEYMSPEQARGRTDLDARSDVYSVGVLLYEAFAREQPYSDTSLGDLLVKIVRGEAEHLRHQCPTLPGDLCDVIMRAMDVDRERRYQSARELRAALEAVVQQAAESLPPWRPVTPPRTRRTSSLEFRWEATDEAVADDETPTIPWVRPTDEA